jgi:hypothetical protein
MIRNLLKSMQSLVSWFFGAPFRQLPSEFGETVPPDLRAFEVAAEESRHNAQGSVPPSFSGSSKRTRSTH